MREAVGRFRNSLTGFALALERAPANLRPLAGVLAYNAAFDDLAVVPCLADLWYAAALPEFLAVPCLAPVAALRGAVEANLLGMLLREVDGFSIATLSAMRDRQSADSPLRRALDEYLSYNQRSLWGIRALVRACREKRCAPRSPLIEMLASGVVKKDAVKLLPVSIPAVVRLADVEDHWDREEAAQ